MILDIGFYCCLGESEIRERLETFFCDSQKKKKKKCLKKKRPFQKPVTSAFFVHCRYPSQQIH